MEILPAITVWYLNSTRVLTGRAHWERWNFPNTHDFLSSVLESTHSQSGSLRTQVIAAELGAGMLLWSSWDTTTCPREVPGHCHVAGPLWRAVLAHPHRAPAWSEVFAVWIWTLSEPEFHIIVLSFLNRGKEGVPNWQVLLLCNNCRIVLSWKGTFKGQLVQPLLNDHRINPHKQCFKQSHLLATNWLSFCKSVLFFFLV